MDWLQKQALEKGHKVFLNGLTFQEVSGRVEDIAGRLQATVGPMKRVAIWSHNSVEMALVLLALLRLQKEVLFLNVHLTVEEVLNQTQDLAIDLLLLSPEMQDKWAAYDDVKEKQRLVDASLKAMAVAGLERLLGKSPVDIPSLAEPADDQIAVIMNTSATTGKFKSVPLRWGQIRAHVEASAQTLGAQDKDNWLMVLPLFHVSGFSILMRSLYNGTAVTIHEKYDEPKALEALQSGSITMVSLVPTILKSLAPKLAGPDGLRCILLGGEYIPEALVDLALEKGLPIYKTYGMTETFSQCVTFSVLDHLDKRASVGRPLPGMQVTIANPDAEGVGEIHVSGPMLMSGYLGREPIEGAFNTDDMGYMDPDGFLYILNRRKDLIISGGENIYPKEIEDCLYGLPFIKECAVVPAEDPKWGQVPALFMAVDQSAWQAYTGNGLQLILDETGLDAHRNEDLIKAYVEAYLKDHLASYKVPKYSRILPALPRNGTGKIVRKDLVL